MASLASPPSAITPHLVLVGHARADAEAHRWIDPAKRFLLPCGWGYTVNNFAEKLARCSQRPWVDHLKAAVEPLAQTMSGGGTGTKTGTDEEGSSQQKET
jgi:hypothetical protein